MPSSVDAGIGNTGNHFDPRPLQDAAARVLAAGGRWFSAEDAFDTHPRSARTEPQPEPKGTRADRLVAAALLGR